MGDPEDPDPTGHGDRNSDPNRHENCDPIGEWRGRNPTGHEDRDSDPTGHQDGDRAECNQGTRSLVVWGKRPGDPTQDTRDPVHTQKVDGSPGLLGSERRGHRNPPGTHRTRNLRSPEPVAPEP